MASTLCFVLLTHRINRVVAGDEPMGQFNLEEDMNDMDIAADGGDEEDIMNEIEVPEDVSEPRYPVIHVLTSSSKKRMTSSSTATPTLA
jgi:hypothetical protein